MEAKMTYFLFERTEYVDPEKKGVSGVYQFDDLDSAVASFHTRMGGAMKREEVASNLCTIMNSDGGIHKQEKYTKRVEQPVNPAEPAAEVTE